MIKMNIRKIFGIGAVILLLLVGITPAINALELEKKANKIEELNLSASSNLRVEITDNIELVSDYPIRLDEDSDEEFSEYKVKYNIINKGINIYVGMPLTVVTPEEDEKQIIDYWYETIKKGDEQTDIVIKPGEVLTREANIKVSCNKDHEKYFVDKNIYLETGVSGLQDYQRSPLADEKYVWKFYKENKEWMPTIGQIQGFGTLSSSVEFTKDLDGDGVGEVFNVSSFMTKEAYFKGGFDGLINYILSLLGDKENLPHMTKEALGLGEGQLHLNEIYEINDDYEIINGLPGLDIIEELWRFLEDIVDYIFITLPETFKNHRLGWLNEMTIYRSRIMIDLIVLGMFCLKFYEDGKTEFNLIGSWVATFIEIIMKTITTGAFPGALFTTWIAEIPAVILSVGKLVEIFFLHGYSVLLYAIFEKLVIDIEKLKEYKGTTPWFEDIYVNGKVGQLREGETAALSAYRETTNPIKTEVTENNGDYEFYVSSKWQAGDLGRETTPTDEYNGWKVMHRVLVTCDGDNKDHKPVTTRKFASYCFSGGNIYTYFQLDDQQVPGDIPGTRNRINNRFEFLNRFFSNFPFFQQLLKIIQSQPATLSNYL
jgi:hypothetical protein